MPNFQTVPDKSAGDVFSESMWDLLKDNMNTAIPVLLASSTLSGSQASIDMTSVPADWGHLLLVAYLRGDTATGTIAVNLRLNGDSGSNYDYQSLAGSGATASAAEAFGQAQARVGSCPAASATASVFGALVIDIPFYSQADNNKAFTSQSCNKSGTSTGNLGIEAYGGAWRSSALVSQVTILPGSGNFVSGSRVSLYGMP